MKKFIFGTIGAILGIPLSYFFQNFKPDFDMYIKNLTHFMSSDEIAGKVLISIIIFALIGGFIGNYIDKNAKTKTN